MPFPVDIAAVRKAEEKLGVALPARFVERMVRANGGDVVFEEDVWSLHPFLDTSDAEQLARTDYDIGRGTADAREWDVFPPGGVAIASNGLGDALVFLPDPQHSGQLQPTVFMWSHETGELDVVAKDFGELELYAELKEDLQALSTPLFAFAEQQVRKRGAFLPFGAALARGGEVTLHAASDGKEVTSSTDLLPILHEGLRSAAAEHDFSAVAVCEWVKITPQGGGQTDAVKVLVEHERGLTIAFYMPCRRRALLGWRFDAMFAKPVEAEVRPPWKRHAAQQ